jgi:hypothetical protein
MKIKYLFAVLAIIATTMTSCKKNYTCKCQRTYTGNSGSVTIDDGTYTFDDNKIKAASRCNDLETTTSDYTRNCSIQ